MTKLFERILVATDGSERSRAAVRKGIEIARACGSALHVIYVIDESAFTSGQADVIPEDLYLNLQAEGESAVGQAKRIAEGMQVNAHVLSGKPAQVITGFAARNGVDLIVVGSLGKTGLERLLLGSTAEKIIRTAGCMVLVVKG
jgi:nucleotide-binding universal stress UspA family protein